MPKTLTLDDYKKAATPLAVEVAAIQAVAQVESRGDGFLPDGHPLILFERHVMFRELREKFGQAKATSWSRTYPNIVNPTPGDYGKVSDQPARLALATTLDRDCALKSASWGKFQIMGLNWSLVGYPSLQAFINAMYRSEADHLHAFCEFIKADPVLHKALKDRNWATFAKRYNGPAYAINQYDKKMAEAYKKLAFA